MELQAFSHWLLAISLMSYKDRLNFSLPNFTYAEMSMISKITYQDENKLRANSMRPLKTNYKRIKCKRECRISAIFAQIK